jgi:hypothetical protein
LKSRVDAGSGAIGEPGRDDVGEVQEKLVLRLEPVGVHANGRPVVADADQQVSALRVQERRDRLQHRVRDDLRLVLG